MKFIPIRTLANIIPINSRFRSLFAEVSDLKARIDALDGNTEAETVAVEESQVVTEVVAEPAKEVQAEPELEEIDPKSQNHPVRVKAKAKGVSSWHTKGIAKLEEELAEIAKKEAGE